MFSSLHRDQSPCQIKISYLGLKTRFLRVKQKHFVPLSIHTLADWEMPTVTLFLQDASYSIMVEIFDLKNDGEKWFS